LDARWRIQTKYQKLGDVYLSVVVVMRRHCGQLLWLSIHAANVIKLEVDWIVGFEFLNAFILHFQHH
jgi:hypothetical protein